MFKWLLHVKALLNLQAEKKGEVWEIVLLHSEFQIKLQAANPCMSVISGH